MKFSFKSILTTLVFTLSLLPAQEDLVPIYRFYSTKNKDHFYTKNASPKGTWKPQGIEFYAYPEQIEGTVPIYRFYSTKNKDHFYTKNASPKGTWKPQGIEFYAYPEQIEGTVPIYRFYSTKDKDHFYTKNASQKDKWKPQGIECYAFDEPPDGIMSLAPGEGEKKVIAIGYGKNPNEALAQALRNAVEDAMGSYMTSTTRIENDELIEDKILSLSRGFIKDFKSLTEDKVDDEYMVRVAAIITDTKILETLKASGVQVEFKGGLFFQQFAAEKKQKEDEKNIVTEYIKNVPDVSLFNFEMEAAKPIKYNPVNNPMRRSRYDVQSDKDLYDIEIKVKISINDNYQIQYTNLKNFISEIAFDNTLIKNQWLFISGTKFVLPIHSKSKIGKHQITQELWKKTVAEYPQAFSYNYSSPSPTVSYGRSRSLNNEWKDDKVEMISYRDYFSKSYAPYVIIFGESQEKRKEKNVSGFSSVEKTNCLVAKLLNEETLSLLNWFGANYFAQPGFKILAHGADVECQLGLVLDDRGNESIQRLNDRAQKSITNDEIVHSKNKDTWNPTAMKTLSYLDRGGRYPIPVGYIVSKKDRRKKAAKKAAGGFAKALAKAAIEQQSKGAISFEKNKADKVDETVVDMGYSYFNYVGQTIPGFFANMEEPYAEVSFHLILDENEIQKITMLEVQPLGPKSINRDKDN